MIHKTNMKNQLLKLDLLAIERELGKKARYGGKLFQGAKK